VKAVYDDGYLVELAVFAPDEIGLALLNRTRVLLDRADVTDRVAAVVAGTPGRIPADAESDAYLEGQLLTALLVGVQRHRRGEHVSGIDFVHRFALRHFLVLLARHVETDRPEVKDDLNPFRRVELAYPAVGAELGRLLATGDLEVTARGLLELAARVLSGPFDTGRPAWETIRRSLAPLES
jgi:lincosamide nucleotidyltransferase